MGVTVITGCGSGIGLATAVAFARRGDLTYASMRDPAKAGPLREAAADAGVAVEVLALDVTDDASVAAAFDEVHARHGRVDVLVNNAGVAHRGPLEVIEDRYVRANMETNYFGPLRTIRAVLPGMRERRSGVIVNVSSIGGRVPGLPTAFSYCASKRAVCALSESLSHEVRPFGVRVVSIEPGYFATSIPDKSSVADPGPYAALVDGVLRSNRTMVDTGADPRVCADAIVAAVEDPATPLHVPVGADAEEMAGLLATGTDEDFLRRVYPLLDTGLVGPAGER
jgi:NAD(P)-dependent dehydrogenase (short-subunit alcohol dehydrogenase family)